MNVLKFVQKVLKKIAPKFTKKICIKKNFGTFYIRIDKYIVLGFENYKY